LIDAGSSVGAVYGFLSEHAVSDRASTSVRAA
jgi:hypothetical protein